MHSAAVVAQHFALLAQVLRVLLALVRHVQAIGLLQGPLGRGRREKAQGGERRGQQERQKDRMEGGRQRGGGETGRVQRESVRQSQRLFPEAPGPFLPLAVPGGTG